MDRAVLFGWLALATLGLGLGFGASLSVGARADDDPSNAVQAGAARPPDPEPRGDAFGRNVTDSIALAAAGRHATAARPQSRFLAAELGPDDIAARLRASDPIRLKPVGTTSVVYKSYLRGPIHSAFKPASIQHPRGHLHEIAAYRLARMLAMDNVPPAVFRRLDENVIKDKLDPEFEDAWEAILAWTVWNDDRSTDGTAIYWIPEMRSFGLEQRMTRWSRWLDQAEVLPKEKASLARDLSTMVAFDYLIGNWDRWSGGNVQGTPDGQRLFVRDHNVAFSAPLHPDLHGRVLGHMLRAERFSRSFVRAVATLEEKRIRGVLSAPLGTQRTALLEPRQIDDVLERRRTFLSYVGALIDAYGEDRVLVFP